MESDQNVHKKNPDNPKEFQSDLCGGQYCSYVKAVDGYWGTNTKNLWKKYGQCYLNYFNVDDTYESNHQDLKDASNKNKESDYGFGSC